VARLSAGQIVIVDWRDGLPNEPNKRRPAVVVEDTDLFSVDFPNVILVPLTEHSDFAITQLSVVIDPTEANQCPSRCYALSHAITTISKRRIMQTTASHITGEQLRTIRLQCAESIGL
jgi:mRNA-degrading endonuclease toxin of MazEF toxin-antitoxin module